MSISESGQYDLLDQRADEFAARFRRGEHPTLKEYTDNAPLDAKDIKREGPRRLQPIMTSWHLRSQGDPGGDVRRPGGIVCDVEHRVGTV